MAWLTIRAIGRSCVPLGTRSSPGQSRRIAAARMPGRAGLSPSGLTVPQADPQPAVALQLAQEVGGGAEDQGLDERDAALLLERLLPLQQRSQLLGLEVGGDQGAVHRGEPALGLPCPGARITPQSGPGGS